MTDFSSALALSAGGLRAQSARLRHVSENIANTDTPGYRRKLVEFDPISADDKGRPNMQTRLDPADLRRLYDPSHPLADADGGYDGSNVDLLIEIADAREAQRSYEANLKMFDQARQMSSALMDLVRR